jgi:hypothetical protein
MPAPTRLMVSGNAVVNSSGVATVNIGPVIHGEKWEVEKVIVSSTSVLNTTASVYRTSVAAANLVDATYNGNLDTSDTPSVIFAPEILVIQWTGGTPAASCSVRIEGTRSFGRRV